MTNYAFFDVDRTIYPGYTMAEFFPLMVRNGVIKPEIAEETNRIHSAFQAGRITYKEAGEQSIQLLAKSIANKRVDNIQALTNGYYLANKLNPWVSELFTLLHTHNYQIILVSGSPSPIVQAIANVCAVDGSYCSLLEVIDSKYSGYVTRVLDDTEKSKLIAANYDLSNSFSLAFGDSTGDIPMLSLANHAFIVDPHQPEMKDLVLSHDNWYVVNEQNILDQVQTILALQ